MRLEFTPLGHVIHVDNDSFRMVALSVTYLGFSPLRQVSASVVFDAAGSHHTVFEADALHSGESLGPVSLALRDSALDGSYFHVSWLTPGPLRSYAGIRYQAVRVSPGGKIQVWRWHRNTRVRAVLQLRPGRWIAFRGKDFDPDKLRGWPSGRSSEQHVLSGDD